MTRNRFQILFGWAIVFAPACGKNGNTLQLSMQKQIVFDNSTCFATCSGLEEPAKNLQIEPSCGTPDSCEILSGKDLLRLIADYGDFRVGGGVQLERPSIVQILDGTDETTINGARPQGAGLGDKGKQDERHEADQNDHWFSSTEFRLKPLSRRGSLRIRFEAGEQFAEELEQMFVVLPFESSLTARCKDSKCPKNVGQVTAELRLPASIDEKPIFTWYVDGVPRFVSGTVEPVKDELIAVATHSFDVPDDGSKLYVEARIGTVIHRSDDLSLGESELTLGVSGCSAGCRRDRGVGVLEAKLTGPALLRAPQVEMSIWVDGVVTAQASRPVALINGRKEASWVVTTPARGARTHFTALVGSKLVSSDEVALDDVLLGVAVSGCPPPCTLPAAVGSVQLFISGPRQLNASTIRVTSTVNDGSVSTAGPGGSASLVEGSLTKTGTITLRVPAYGTAWDIVAAADQSVTGSTDIRLTPPMIGFRMQGCSSGFCPLAAGTRVVFELSAPADSQVTTGELTFYLDGVFKERRSVTLPPAVGANRVVPIVDSVPVAPAGQRWLVTASIGRYPAPDTVTVEIR